MVITDSQVILNVWLKKANMEIVYDPTINSCCLRHRFVGIKGTLIHTADEFRNCAN
jgi:hypothetical protein